ncbi:4-(cytidine 5'-diphospho)-2-C-methyl-D-erythritol kinase [Rhodoblastus sp.]|uniref:4-(cytidine 5'-diphospho)-2-C-methyl-D-erythritol kinase n=1 Tax=Rhodoblastus sp. TaxID=1962975 RepID=UPI003F9ABF53
MSFSKFFATRAPAKINLTLHIEGRRDDGYHELHSLVAFAGAADYLTLAPGEEFALTLEGPTAQAAGEGGDNLVARAERALREEKPGLRSGAFHLVKRLPVAAGVGGGSSDAAAALRLLARANGLSPDDPALYAAARKTGADVPVCLTPRGKMMSGIGERLGPPIKLPPLFAVLVNPRQPVETRAVFAKLGLKPGENNGFGGHPAIAENMDFESLLRSLKKGRNDMEDAACVLAPVIGHVLAVLSGARGCRLARMSGSGATCFALFETCRQAGVAARAISRGHPEWWVKTTILR